MDNEEKGFVVGRVCQISAHSGDLWYLRMLLNWSKGATAFVNLCTIDGVVYDNVKEACRALDLLNNDNEWHEAIRENETSAMPSQLKMLFVHILAYSQVSDPVKLWNDHWRYLSDDILYYRRLQTRNESLFLDEE